MTKHSKEGAGGSREGAGKKQKYGEPTVTVLGERIPESKEQEYRKWHAEKVKPLIQKKLKSWIKPVNSQPK